MFCADLPGQAAVSRFGVSTPKGTLKQGSVPGFWRRLAAAGPAMALVGGLGKRGVSTPKGTLKQGSGPAAVFCAALPGQSHRALVQSKSLAVSASCTVTNRAGGEV